jgi:hypothetical protein
MAVLLAMGIVSVARAGGLAHNADFVVLAPDQPLADAVLAKAASLRSEIAREWLGEELPPSVARVAIHVEITDTNEDRGLFWPIDSPERTLHKIWITTSRDAAVGSALAHEMVHACLAARYGRRLPAWCDEGAASLSDDAERAATRARILQWFASTGNWPELTTIFAAKTISSDDQAQYAVAASVTEYLLTKASRAAFLRFAVDAQAQGCDAALATHYRIRGVTELQGEWQSWLARKGSP